MQSLPIALSRDIEARVGFVIGGPASANSWFKTGIVRTHRRSLEIAQFTREFGFRLVEGPIVVGIHEVPSKEFQGRIGDPLTAAKQFYQINARLRERTIPDRVRQLDQLVPMREMQELGSCCPDQRSVSGVANIDVDRYLSQTCGQRSRALPTEEKAVERSGSKKSPLACPLPASFRDGGCEHRLDASLLAYRDWIPLPMALSDPAPTLLVIDDDRMIRNLLRNYLSGFGYRVLEARCGLEGIAVYREMHEHINLVLLDVQMPRLDGVATLAELRKIDPGVRCLFLSGNPDRVLSDAALPSGVVHVLNKPFTLPSVLSAVQNAGVPLGG